MGVLEGRYDEAPHVLVAAEPVREQQGRAVGSARLRHVVAGECIHRPSLASVSRRQAFRARAAVRGPSPRVVAMSEPSGHEADGPPEQSTDDTDNVWGERPDQADDDERIAREKPPHYSAGAAALLPG